MAELDLDAARIRWRDASSEQIQAVFTAAAKRGDSRVASRARAALVRRGALVPSLTPEPMQAPEGLKDRLLEAARLMPGLVTQALVAVAEDARVRVDSGPGGLAHIRTERLYRSLQGESDEAIEVVDDERFALTLGTEVRYAGIQQRRFQHEGELVPINADAAREAVEELVFAQLRKGFS